MLIKINIYWMEKKIKEGLELYPASEKTQLRSHDDLSKQWIPTQSLEWHDDYFPMRENAMNSSNQMYLLNWFIYSQRTVWASPSFYFPKLRNSVCGTTQSKPPQWRCSCDCILWMCWREALQPQHLGPGLKIN